MAIGKQVGKLYYLDSTSFPSTDICQQLNSSVVNNTSAVSKFALWHRRLGHTSPLVLSHIDVLNIVDDDKAEGQKAYKLYDLENKNILVSRDLVFYESEFPYHKNNHALVSNPGPLLVPTLALDDPIDSITEPDSTAHIPTETPLNTPTLDIVPPPILDQPRRSERHSKPAAWLTDFHCNLSSDYVIHPSNITSSHKGFLAALSTIQEPRCYKEAKGNVEWEQAMQQELEALEQNNTWEIVHLPKDKRAIGSKWVYKVKLKSDGSVDRYNARLVAKGYNQVEGVDYINRFSPIAKVVTARTFLVIGSSYNWPIHQIDINNVFLHGYLDEDIYMLAPDGYQIQPGMLCKLKRQSQNGYCLYLKDTDHCLLALLVYVDDVLITYVSEDEILQVKHLLDTAFTIKDLGPAKYFLGLEIARSTAGTSITQHKLIQDIIQDACLLSVKPTSTPLPMGLKLSSHSTCPLSDPEPYRRLVGRLFLSQLH
ncbi:UNVERIFIED_CONTAM: Retrovirus-related Pol polyprotein from transposon RE2 [Sesamum latifolium]|uniref:Retrovirus-related Pol polyprotein from transposon RE2 n=1 Tax=Sesamum latifolium TaxID=2727402 RepID=A0AAW2XXE4_9LAMI